MNKAEWIANVAATAGLTKKDAEKAINAFIENVEGALKKGDKVQLVGFGTFEVREIAERTGRNPRTRKEIKIPACKKPAFKVGQGLKNAVN